jgi:hypothetical protein
MTQTHSSRQRSDASAIGENPTLSEQGHSAALYLGPSGTKPGATDSISSGVIHVTPGRVHDVVGLCSILVIPYGLRRRL